MENRPRAAHGPGGRRAHVRVRQALPRPGAVVRLLRLPAVLTVPGDALLGAAVAGAERTPARTAGLVGSSACLYLAGMALNDFADRDVDAVERPHRPIPAGEVTPAFALALASALTAAGVGLAVTSGGRAAGKVALPLAATVWAYDLALKDTPAGPVAMAAARTLDVLLGAAGAGRDGALAAAAVVGGHTLKITSVSRHEVQGGAPGVARAALAGTAAVVVGAAGVVSRTLRLRGRGRSARALLAGALLGGYARESMRAERAAAAESTPAAMQQAVGTGILGFIPLEAGMHAAAGPVPATLALAGLWPVARRLARRRAVT